MTFAGFTQTDFDTFTIGGLEPRMAAIRERIQPKFKELGQDLTDFLAMVLGNEMYLHIAQHLRRKTNPPVDTWLAVAPTKRGYKQVPHFQVGLFDDRLFVWLALIYELPDKKEYAEAVWKHAGQVLRIIKDNDMVLSQDHMKKDILRPDSMEPFLETIRRFKDVKKAELLIGKQFASDDPLLKNGNDLAESLKRLFTELSKIYTLLKP